MEHHFHGPSYTLGIEEELMIVDAEGYGLVNAIESLLQDAEDGEIKPELMESVLEISTNPAPDTAQAGEQLRRLRTQVRRTAAGARPDHRLGGHASVRDVGGPAHRRPRRATASWSRPCASSRARS